VFQNLQQTKFQNCKQKLNSAKLLDVTFFTFSKGPENRGFARLKADPTKLFYLLNNKHWSF